MGDMFLVKGYFFQLIDFRRIIGGAHADIIVGKPEQEAPFARRLPQHLVPGAGLCLYEGGFVLCGKFGSAQLAAAHKQSASYG